MLNIFETNTFPPLHHMVEENYLEQYKETGGGNLYYIDYKRKVLISAFCVVGDCPTSTTITEKKRSKVVEMFFIDESIHQSFFELGSTA